MKTVQLLQMMPEELVGLFNESLIVFIEDLKKSLNVQSSDELLTRTETCEFLKINSSTLWAWTKKGNVTAYGLCNRRYYKKAELLENLVPLKNNNAVTIDTSNANLKFVA